MKGKVVLITGGSTGIGKATAQELAKMGATVLFVSQNEQRGQQALTDIKKYAIHADVTFLRYDLSSMTQVRQLARDVQKRHKKLDVLINNAGILPGKLTITAEGFELSWALNHLAPFLLTNLLTDQLLNAPSARIITVSSEAHRLGQINLNGPSSANQYSSFTAYCDSKFANILFTYELARRLELTTITANCLHPGVIASNFGDTSFGLLKWLFKLGRPFMRNNTQGAATSIYLASSPAVSGLTGIYFKDKKPAKSAKSTYSLPAARQLWRLSAEQTGLFSDPDLD